MTTSQNGWAAGSREQAKIRTYRVPGTSIALAMNADVAPLLLDVAASFNRLVEPLRKGWCWGFATRPIRGGHTPSNHQSGTALDFNAPRHVLGMSPLASYTPKQVATIRALLRRYVYRGKALIQWGGDYHGRKDGMHFELAAGVTLADVRGWVAARRAAVVKKVTDTTISLSAVRSISLKGVGSNADVKLVQWALNKEKLGGNLALDGRWGPRTAQRWALAEKKLGIPNANGVIGSDSLRRLCARHGLKVTQ